MSLARLFTIVAAVLVALVATMATRVAIVEWHAVRSADDGLDAIGVTRLALIAAEKASVERGPTNGVLGDGDHRDPAKGQRLAAARAATDAALSALDGALIGATQPAFRQAARTTAETRRFLNGGRTTADAIAAKPKRLRTAEVMTAVHAMFDVIPPAMQTAATLSRVAEDAHPQFADMLIAARLAAELREYAGRLGSQYTAALTAQAPLGTAQQFEIAALRGRIDELHHLVELRTAVDATPDRIVAADGEMERSYFGTGLAIAAAVERASAERRPYGMDTAQFAAAYVPTMGSIVALRDTLLDVAATGARTARSRAQQTLLLAVVAALAAVALVAGLIAIIRRRVLQPLVQATNVIVEIAQGRLDTPVPLTGTRDEIGRMFEAVAVLRATSAEKDRLEDERVRLFDELRELSTTDYLTALPNRRAFTDTANGHIANAKRHRLPFALVMFDLDHFKAVNDHFGHEAGDCVLKEVARIAAAEFREGDIVARHGGEEFVALALHCQRSALAALTERVRVAIASASIVIPDGRTVRITSSFGAAVCADGCARLDTMLRLADRALYAAKEGGRDRVVIAESEPLAAP